jgi:hypothetical protein
MYLLKTKNMNVQVFNKQDWWKSLGIEIGRIVKNLLGLKICENTRRIEPVSSKIFLRLTKTDKIVKLLVLSYVHQENKSSYVYTSLI